jgi:hypothetical protein
MPTPKQSYPGYVYLIGSTRFGWYKIGKSVRPDIRLSEIGVLLPFRIDLFAMWGTQNHSLLEGAFHREYAVHHIHGEWFCFDRKTFTRLVLEYPPYWGDRIFPVGGMDAKAIAGSAATDRVKKFSTPSGSPDHYKAWRSAINRYIEEHGIDPKAKKGPIKQHLGAKVSGLWNGPIDKFIEALES